jgi:hypothetical protein
MQTEWTVTVSCHAWFLRGSWDRVSFWICKVQGHTGTEMTSAKSTFNFRQFNDGALSETGRNIFDTGEVG